MQAMLSGYYVVEHNLWPMEIQHLIFRDHELSKFMVYNINLADRTQCAHYQSNGRVLRARLFVNNFFSLDRKCVERSYTPVTKVLYAHSVNIRCRMDAFKSTATAIFMFQ